jgi:hypothetical protein
MRGLPTMTPGFPDPNGASQALHRSDLRSLDSAVQSRVGDGFLVVFPLDFRGCNKRNLIRVARLPEHEVRGGSEGREARYWLLKCRYKGRGVGLTRKLLRTGQ